MPDLYTQEKFDAMVAKLAKEYERLSDTKLAKKIRHLVRAEGRCSHPQNAALMQAFRAAALEIARRRRVLAMREDASNG